MRFDEKTVGDVLRHWPAYGEARPIYPSAWAVEPGCILKGYDQLPALERNVQFMKALRRCGIPVPKILPPASGGDYLAHGGDYFLLTSRLPGSPVVRAAQCPDGWFYAMGGILARLHLAFQACEKDIVCWDNSLLAEMKGWVTASFERHPCRAVPPDALSDAVSRLEGFDAGLPRQLIHRDVHLGNFLFDRGEFSGYIDFDLSQRNIRVFDLCYFMLGLLLEGSPNRLSEERWFGALNQVLLGYDVLIPLTQAERAAIPCVMQCIELLFAAFFMDRGEEPLATSAAGLYGFVKENEARILRQCP